MIRSLMDAADDPECSLEELYQLVLEKIDYLTYLKTDSEMSQTAEERIENINELSSNLIQYEEVNEDATLSGFLEEVSLMTDLDQLDDNSDMVVMMTIHAEMCIRDRCCTAITSPSVVTAVTFSSSGKVEASAAKE